MIDRPYFAQDKTTLVKYNITFYLYVQLDAIIDADINVYVYILLLQKHKHFFYFQNEENNVKKKYSS